MSRPSIRISILAFASGLALPLCSCASTTASEPKSIMEVRTPSYGIVRSFIALPGERRNFVRALIEGYRDMPGCRSFIVSIDPTDESTVWVTETWASRERRLEEFETPRIRAAAANAKKFLERRDMKREFQPLGGVGL